MLLLFGYYDRRRPSSRRGGGRGTRLQNANESTGEIGVAGGGAGSFLGAVMVDLRGHGSTDAVCLGGFSLEDQVWHPESVMAGRGGGASSRAGIEALAR